LAALAGVGRGRRADVTDVTDVAVERDTGHELVLVEPATAAPSGPSPKAVTWSAAPMQAVAAAPDRPDRSAVTAPPPPGESPKIVGRAVVIRRELT
jgi:hypothetical protein